MTQFARLQSPLLFLLLPILWMDPCRSDAVTSKFNVLLPKELAKPNPGYDHRDAMFGVPPYGGSLQQPVYYARGTMCQGLSKKATKASADWVSPFILLVDRGDCSFVQKVRNSQKAGASAVLIADDVCICGHDGCPDAPGYDEATKKSYFCESTEPIMADDGSGSDITIPSFLLFKEDADPLRNALVNGKHVRVQMTFSVPAPDARVEFDLWTSPADSLVRELQEDFFSAVMALSEHASFTPHMYIYDGNTAGCHGDDGEDYCLDLCSNSGRYCSVDLDLHSGATGAEVVTEALRRICIWNLYGSDGVGLPWWLYAQEFTKLCDSGSFDMGGKQFSDEDCVAKAMNAAGITKSDVDHCMEQSGGTEGDNVNTLLDKEIADQTSSGVILVPSLLVNQAVIRGFLNFQTTFKAICAGFAAGSEPPICQECATCHDERLCVEHKKCISSGISLGSSKGSVSQSTFIATVAILLVVFAIVGYIYHQRQQNEMRNQIQNVVAEYMPVTSQNADNSTSLAIDEDEDGDGDGDGDEGGQTFTMS